MNMDYNIILDQGDITGNMFNSFYYEFEEVIEWNELSKLAENDQLFILSQQLEQFFHSS